MGYMGREAANLLKVAFSNGGAADLSLEPRSLAFDDLARILSNVGVGRKDGPYYIRGGELLEPTRSNANLLSADLLIIDGDSGFDPETGELTSVTDPETGELLSTAPPMADVTAALDRLGLQYIAHTSHSYRPGLRWKYRVVIPARMKNAAELSACVDYVLDRIHSAGVCLLDVKENKTWAQAWYLPRVAEAAATTSFAHIVNAAGKPLDVEACVAWATERSRRAQVEAEVRSKPGALREAMGASAGATGSSVIEEFNRKHGLEWVRAELERRGYRFAFKRGDTFRYIRPGSETGVAGVVVFKGSEGDWCTYSHHGAADPLSHKLCDPFAIMAHFEHGGDYKAAARRLIDERPKDPNPTAAQFASGAAWGEPYGAKGDDRASTAAGTSEGAQAAAGDGLGDGWGERPEGDFVPLLSPWARKAADIPRRDWIIPGLLIRRHITLLSAPGGSGKSLLGAQIAIALALGISWNGWRPIEPVNVLLINSEDDADELQRRIHAACEVMNVDPADLEGRLFLAENPINIVVAKTDRDGVVHTTPLVPKLMDTIKRQKISVVMADPLTETIEGDENSNSEMKWAAAIWRGIGRECNASVMLVHHTSKGSAGKAGNADVVRGASALVNSARIVSTLFTMSEDEAALFNVNPAEAYRYCRFDDAKANLSLITGKARWFEKVTIELENGDSVGVLKPWAPAGTFDGVSVDTIHGVLKVLDAGRDAGKYRYNLKSGPIVSPAWAGFAVMRATGFDRPRAAKIVEEWSRSGLLVPVEYTDEQRKSKVGVKVDFSKSPGGQ